MMFREHMNFYRSVSRFFIGGSLKINTVFFHANQTTLPIQAFDFWYKIINIIVFPT